MTGGGGPRRIARCGTLVPMSRRGSGPAKALAEGVYEHLITEELARALAAAGPIARAVERLDEADASATLARHVGQVVARALAGVSAERAREVIGDVLDHLAGLVGEDVAEMIRDQRPQPPPARLLALHRGAVPARPTSPLGTSTLLTRKRLDPTLGHELAREIATADEVDAIIAFVTVGGVRAIRDALHDFARGPAPRLRLLTTTFTGTTEVAALDTFARLPGAEVRVSYDTRRTRLHAKAWLFRRDTGLTTAYVGSANLTSTALGAGQEWMVKVCAADLPHVIEQFEGTFDTLWSEPEFEPYAPDDPAQRRRLQAALSVGDLVRTGRVPGHPPRAAVPGRDPRQARGRAGGPWPPAQPRRRGDRHRQDGDRRARLRAPVRRDRGRAPAAVPRPPPRAARPGARDVPARAAGSRRSASCWSAITTPERWDHVFASIQRAASTDLLARFGADHFRHVIVDECHHVPAASYQAVVPRLRPELLVGLTATPERSDGKSLLPDFDGHIAAELRLWHALDGQLLVPFEYYGLSDGVDLRTVRWSRTGYDTAALGDLYTGHTARADLIRHQLGQPGRRSAPDPRARVLRQRRARRVHGRAVHGGRDPVAGGPRRQPRARRGARGCCASARVNVLFTCDLYNEGVDLPFVDTLLLLRPTQSATLFLQQLGRGLRHHAGKASCLVLDFIGQHRDEFRFDVTLGRDHRHPAGAAAQGDRGRVPVPAERLRVPARSRSRARRSSARSAPTLAGARRLATELRELAAADRARPTLAQFLDETGRDLDDVYDAGGWTNAPARRGPGRARARRGPRGHRRAQPPARLAPPRRRARPAAQLSRPAGRRGRRHAADLGRPRAPAAADAGVRS